MSRNAAWRPSGYSFNGILQETPLLLAKRASGDRLSHFQRLLQLAGLACGVHRLLFRCLGQHAVLDAGGLQMPRCRLRRHRGRLSFAIETFDKPELPIMQLALLGLARGQLPFGDTMQLRLDSGDTSDFAVS